MDKALYTQIHQIEATHWWYVARRKIIFDWVLQALKEHPTPRVLDIGCGTGFNLECLSQRGNVDLYGLDISVEALAFCRQRGLRGLVAADGSQLPFEEAAFEVILALDMLEHLDNDTRAVQECARLLKPNGTLVLFVPAFMFLWGLQDEVSHHRRRYTLPALRQQVLACGLQVAKISYANTFLFPLILAGRLAMRWARQRPNTISENDLSPRWMNGLLTHIFAAERPLLRGLNFPFGVSILCIARKPT